MADIETRPPLSEEQNLQEQIAAGIRSRRRLPMLLSPKEQSFGSAEHRELGDRLYLWVPASLQGIDSSFMHGKIKVAEGVVLTYGQIVALAGDLYGIPDRPISNGKTDQEHRDRFVAAYSTLRDCDREELGEILKIMDSEARYINDKMINGWSEPDAYGVVNWDERYARATGYWTTGIFKTGRYLDLARNNVDHFGHDAKVAYKAGHAVALQKALEGYQYLKAHSGTAAKQHAAALFEQALAMSAFADHYLTDMFASGHLRVPRRKLEYDWGASGGVMAKRQHEEDGAYGLFVKNNRGEYWRCFGDEHLNTFAGRENKIRAFIALQDSMTEVWRAFEFGENPANYGALNQTPDLYEVGRHETDAKHNNFAAAYIERDKHIDYRYPRKEIDRHHWETVHAMTWP
jgi:hypothetical protein